MKKTSTWNWEDALDEALRKFPIGHRVYWRWKRSSGWIQYEGVVVSYQWRGAATFVSTAADRVIKGAPWLSATVRTDTRRTYHVTPQEMRRKP